MSSNYSIDRREFIQLGLTLSLTAFSLHRCSNGFKADVAVIGGGLGGVACALSALEHGLTVVITEETDWLGGQLTTQGVPPDENPWVETVGATKRYKSFRNAIRDYYRKNYRLREEYRNTEHLNPGNGFVSRLCHEPIVSARVIDLMFDKYVRTSSVEVRNQTSLTILKKCVPHKVAMKGDRIESICVVDVENHRELWIEAEYFVDATEMGDLLKLGGIEYVIGAESKRETGEPHALDSPDPTAMQACTWCFAMEYHPDRDCTIERPHRYDFWKNYIPALDPPWTGPLFSFTTPDPITLQARTLPFAPEGDVPYSWWRYRQILDKGLFEPDEKINSITLVNWPQNDYFLSNIIENQDPNQDIYHQQRAKELSLCFFYWLQTDAPRPDGETGWRGLRLRGDVLGTSDGFAKKPYVRESRRIKAEFTICEQHISKEVRKEFCKGNKLITAEKFFDTVGIGYYRIDLHPRTNGKNYFDVESLPFQIPLGALIPIRVENLIPACKNIGTTHITNGAYRLHQVEWHIGEAVGCLLAYCIQKGLSPRMVRKNHGRLEELQSLLVGDGIPIHWDEDILRQYGKVKEVDGYKN